MGKQKRSENTYQKINSIFMRDDRNVIMPYSGFVEPEFEWLKDMKWRGEEKIDGTSIRIEVTKCPTLTGVSFDVAYRGKTDNADIPKQLLKYLEENYPEEKVLASLGLKKEIHASEYEERNWLDDDSIPNMYTIYGEGYGAKIQKAGGNYVSNGVGFIVFDIKVNNIWLKTEARDEIASKLGAPVTPLIGYFTIPEAIDFVRKGFKSTISENKEFMAEGLVLRTDVGLLNRLGKRLITKIKTKDFVKYRNVYGTDDPVEQKVNPHL